MATIRRGAWTGLLAAAVTVALPALAQKARIESAPVTTERTRATLVASPTTAGAPLPIALRLELKPGWHTYWRNPGDSGEPAVVTLQVGGREISGPDAWPVPERIDVAGIMSYGYHGSVELVTTLPANAAVRSGDVLRIEATATWLVCEKVCVPENGRFALSVPIVGAGSAPAKTGTSPPSLPIAPAKFARNERGWALRVPAVAVGAGNAKVTDAYFFPERGDLIDHSVPQSLHVSEGEIVLDLAAAPMPAATSPGELRGVLAITRQAADGVREVAHLQLVARPAVDSR